MKKLNFLLTLLACATLVLSGCKKDDPQPQNEQELITFVEVTITNDDDDNDVQVLTATANQAIKPGVAGITLNPASLTLRTNSTYTIEITALEDRSKNPADDILEEVREEADEHQFYFGFANTLFTNLEYLDFDDDDRPLGTRVRVTTAGNPVSNSNFTIVLIHEGDKSQNTPSTPWVLNSAIGGDTDMSLTFPISLAAAPVQ
jgi:hypothetical protein